MIARTRNMEDLTYFCVDIKSKDYKYKDLDDVKQFMKNLTKYHEYVYDL